MEKIETSQDKIKEIEILKADRDIVKSEYNVLKQKEYAEIKIVEDKYRNELSNFNTKVSDLTKQIDDAQIEIHRLIHHEEWIGALSRGVIDELYINALINKCKIGSSNIDIKQKKTTPNNIDIWMISSNNFICSYKFYLAFYKGKLVGTSYRDVSKHAGDPTIPFSFIGQFDKPLMKNKSYEHFVGSYTNVNANATFTDWMDELKTLNLKETILLPMNEDTLNEIKLGKNNYWSEYSWKDKQKI